MDDIDTSINLKDLLSRTEILPKKYLDKNCVVIENSEPLVKLLDVVPGIEERMSKVRSDWTLENGLETDLYARETVCEMLAQVTKILAPAYGLVVFDAYRPTAYQQMRFDYKCDGIRQKNPDWTEDQIREEAFIWVAEPDSDTKKAAPHFTGGAIDLAIKDLETGELLDMGTAYGQFESAMTHTNNLEISAEARANRVFFATVMASVGFTNYPGEWWHFMFGEREWAAYEGKPFAIYGGVDLDLSL